MLITLPYGETSISFEIESKYDIERFSFPAQLHAVDLTGELVTSLEAPVGAESFFDLYSRARDITILISDLTRPGASKLLNGLLSLLEERGVGNRNVKIVIATGMHRPATKEELEAHFGGKLLSRWNFIQHEPRRSELIKRVGFSDRGTPYEFSTHVVDADLVVAVGAVSLHYFAGFGGGRKLILPGVASEETILSNHRLSLRDDPADGLSQGCFPGNLDGNPVHEDMINAISFLKARLFAINYICNDTGEVVFLNSGDIEASHREACREYLRLFSVRLKSRYKCAVISAGGYPKDINFLQAHKAIRAISHALEDGALIFCAFECREGVGSQSYLDAFADGLEGVIERVRSEYTLNSQTAISTLELVKRFQIYVKSELEESVVNRFGFNLWDPDQTQSILEKNGVRSILIADSAPIFLPVID